jgi:pimeloyl-ACP methyl ester carboxylesterase
VRDAGFYRVLTRFYWYESGLVSGFDELRSLDKIGQSMAVDFDYSDVVRGLQVPTMIIAADADMAPPSHYVEVFKLLDGGLRDGGWMGEGRPKGGHALAILPGLTHDNMASSPLLAAAALDYLDTSA